MDENFKKKIAEDFGLSQMDAEEQEKYIEKIGNMLFESVIERSLAIMDDSATTDFEALIAEVGSDYQKVISFLQTRVPNFQEIVSDELSRLKRLTSGIFV